MYKQFFLFLDGNLTAATIETIVKGIALLLLL